METLNISKEPTAFASTHQFMQKVDEVILQNMNKETFCISDLQQELLMSSSQIYRKVKQETGHSPSVYIRNIRLKYAYKLVSQSDLSFSEIAFRVGFNSLAYFSRCFTNYYGASPSGFRYEGS